MRAGWLLKVFCFSALALCGLQLASPLSKALTPVEFDIKPETLNVDRQGRWITGYISIATDEYDVGDIDTTKPILLDGLFHAVWSRIAEGKLVVKFDYNDSLRDHLLGKLLHYGERVSVDLEVTGQMKDGITFSGWDKITIIHPPFGN